MAGMRWRSDSSARWAWAAFTGWPGLVSVKVQGLGLAQITMQEGGFASAARRRQEQAVVGIAQQSFALWAATNSWASSVRGRAIMPII
jgi:hypothetical protein